PAHTALDTPSLHDALPILLTDDEKRLACQLAKEAGAHFVKTSTGFSSGGATVADIELMRAVVGDSMGIKASGGVRDRASAEAMRSEEHTSELQSRFDLVCR